MSFVIPAIIDVVLLAGIIAFQVLAFKSEGKLFWILSFVTGGVSGIVSLLIASYYSAVVERLQSQFAIMSSAASGEISSAETYILVCIFIAFAFFASLLITAALLIIKRIIKNR